MVSSPSCEDFRSLHSILTTSKKLNKLKNQNLFLFCQRSKVTGQTIAPQIEDTDRWIQRIITYQSRNLHGNQCECRKTWTIIEELLEVQCGQAWEIKTPEGPSHSGALTFCEFNLQKLYQALTVNIREIYPCASERGRGNKSFWSM